MKLFLPKQHGAWAMLIIPFWLGAAASAFTWAHIPFFLGWILLYLSTYPMLLLFKKKKIAFYRKWTIYYMIPAILLLLIPLWARPSIIIFGLLMIPFFMINAYYSSRNRDRALGNDISAIFAFSIAGLASSYLPNGEITLAAIIVFVTSILFFTGSTFYVKTMIREKKNQRFKAVSWAYHSLIIILWVILGKWLIAISFLPSFFRAFLLNGKKMTAKNVGMLEIANAAFFFIMLIFKVV